MLYRNGDLQDADPFFMFDRVDLYVWKFPELCE